jgi:hypothetical protein
MRDPEVPVRRLSRAFPALLLAALLPFPSEAQQKANDASVLREEAGRRMKISFDYDQLEGELRAPAAAPPAETLATGVHVRRAPLPLVANSDVIEVTVFRDRALVTRERTVDVERGDTLVDFVGLPLDIRPESFHAGVGAGSAEILGIERLTGQGLAVRQAEQQRLRDSLRPLVDRVGESRDRIEALLAERAYLREAAVPSGDAATRVPVLEMEKTLAFVAKEERRIAAALREEERKVEELDRDIAPLLARMQDPQADGEKVRVRVHAGKQGTIAVSLRYEVAAAGWSPAYRARLPEGGGPVELAYDGVVRQWSGEDWGGARLVLSTADAGAPGAPPPLSAWTLEEGQAYWTQQHEPTTGSSAPAAPSARAAVVFAVPGVFTVRGDGSEQRLPVATLSMPATETRVAVPRSAQQVFRRVEVVHAGSLPLLAGPVSLFVGADMVASSTIAPVAPGERFELHFGGDEQMKAERVVVERKQEYVGPGRKTVRWTFRYTIRVQNLRDEAVTVRVADQLPVAISERVVVKPLEMTTPLPTDVRDPQGVTRWDVAVPPGGESTIDFGFQVTSPADVQIADLMML